METNPTHQSSPPENILLCQISRYLDQLNFYSAPKSAPQASCQQAKTVVVGADGGEALTVNEITGADEKERNGTERLVGGERQGPSVTCARELALKKVKNEGGFARELVFIPRPRF